MSDYTVYRIPFGGRHSTRRCVCCVLAILLAMNAVVSCGTLKTPTPTPDDSRQPGLTYVRGAGPVTAAGGETGMRLALSQGEATPQGPTPVVSAQTEPLTQGEVQAVLHRLPPLIAPPSDTVQFRLPEDTLPAPRPGETIQQPFPPLESAQPGERPGAGPLKVLRYSPEGDVDLAPFLSVTFDQPMVALTAHADLAAQEVPVRLSPLPEGTWRWVGTKTLMYEPVTRFPMATEFTVEIPAGTTSAVGGKLEQTVAWSFRTPAPRMQGWYPSQGPTVRDPLVFISFDQRIEPADVLKTIEVRAGRQSFALALATEEQIEADGTVNWMAKEAGEGRWLAFRPLDLLPYDTTVTIDIGPGTPSVEGPLTTERVQSFGFATYGPLRLIESACGWEPECRPMAPWRIRFSNPLDEEAFSESLVKIDPDLPGGKLTIYGRDLQIEGRSQGRTTYKVTLAADIADQFGQTLGQEQTVTFRVGSAQPVLFVPNESFVVADPASKPVYSVFTINYDAVDVKAYAVQPEDWLRYLEHLREASRDENPGEPPGRRVFQRKVPIEGTPDALTETPIDLSEILEDRTGHLILVIEPDVSMLAQVPRRWKPVVRVWVQATQIGLDAFVSNQQMTAWANSLADGSSLEGVEFTLMPGGIVGRSGADGLGRLPLSSTANEEPAYLIARLGSDRAVLPESVSWWRQGWRSPDPSDECRWYVFDDRRMYRPGEQVHVKGWIRIVGWNSGADVFSRPTDGAAVSYQLVDSRGNQLLAGSLDLNALGGFDTSFELPQTMNLGYASLRLTVSGVSASSAQYSHSLQVQEFRRPEFEVSTSVSAGPHFIGDHATAAVEAKYYAGGPLASAEVTWNVTTGRGTYRPPGWDDFHFGIWFPWWRGFYEWWGVPGSEQNRSTTYQGVTDAAGTHNLRLDFEAADPPLPSSVTAQATVMDVNRQAWSSAVNILVHPADYYVGLRTERTFVQRGEPIKLDAIVTDLDGNPIEDRPVEMRAVRLDWTYSRGEWQEEEVDEQHCTVGSAIEPTSCSFDTPEGGTYRISAIITDGQGRQNLTQLTVWVTGGQRPSVNRVEQEQADLIPDRREYQPGDTAEVLVQSPFVPAEGLLTLRRGGIIHSERFFMDEATHTLRVPILEKYIPNLNIQVDLVGAAPRLDSEGNPDETVPRRPAYASGSLDLAVPAYSRTLSVDVTPEELELEPGAHTVVHVMVRDASGLAVEGAEVAAVVVDEAVLALTGYQIADPVAIFYRSREAGVADYHMRQYILLVDPEQLREQANADQELRTLGAAQLTAAPAPAAEMAKGAGDAAAEQGIAAETIRMRLDFDPLATFEPSLPTDADGHAAVRVTLPDNLTRYRVTVVAVAGDREFGKGESAITARLPLMVRPSPPRFLNFGDKFELPVVVQNQTDQPMTVDVAVRVTNARHAGPSGQRLSVPARDRREVRFPFETDSAGTARFQVGAVSGEWADAAEFDLPVYTPATTEAFAVYGTVDEGAIAQPVIAPTDAFVQFGGLDVSTSSTALQTLSDAVLYLTAYPFECSEQLASRILAVAALRDVLSAFQAKGLPEPEALAQAVQRDIEILQGIQNQDGGFPVWRRGRDSWPFHSIHALHALARASEKGFDVPEEMLTAGLEYVRHVEERWPTWYSKEVRNTLTAYALYVRARLGDVDTARARRLVQEEGAGDLSLEALGWLLSVLTEDARSQRELEEIRGFLSNRVVETAGAANFTTSYREEDGYLLLASNRRADGVILEALVQDQPQSDLIPKVVRGLLAHRKRGRWSNTQENVFILLALEKYFKTYEAQTPEFVARIWLGDQYLGGFQFVGRTTEYQALQIPMAYLSEQAGSQDLILSKEGPGRLYYRLGLSYSPTSLRLEQLDQGFTVMRRYEAVDDPEDVWLDDDGVWHVRAGVRVRVRLTMVAPSRRYHVALVDPMPAGFESLNPALAVTGSIPQDPEDQRSQGRYWWWRWTWYEHQNLRDERTEAFASLLWDGIHTYTYVARATTPGQFIVPPPKAEEMYSPDVFGRGSTDQVVIE